MMDVDDGIFPPGRITISGTREIKKIKQLIQVYHYHCPSPQQSAIIFLPARLAFRRGIGEKPNTTIVPEKRGDLAVQVQPWWV